MRFSAGSAVAISLSAQLREERQVHFSWCHSSGEKSGKWDGPIQGGIRKARCRLFSVLLNASIVFALTPKNEQGGREIRIVQIHTVILGFMT